jgi:hypothetical protein
MMGIPTVIKNSYPGITNKLLSKKQMQSAWRMKFRAVFQRKMILTESGASGFN